MVSTRACKTTNEIQLEQLGEVFLTPPSDEQTEHWLAINQAAKAFAETVIQTVPWSRDRDRSLEAIREAAMWARESLLTYKPARMVGDDPFN